MAQGLLRVRPCASLLASSARRPLARVISSPRPFLATSGHARFHVTVCAAGGDGSAGAPAPGNDQGPQAISLIQRIQGPGYTFVLAGFLKILTLGAIASSAPVDTVRTAAGKMSPYLMVPIGLGMCALAKFIVDNDLQESRRFMTGLVAFLIFLYFGLYKLLYRYDPAAELPRRARATASSPMAQARAWAGDREIGAPEGTGGVAYRGDSRVYAVEGHTPAGSTKRYDDLAYYEGRYASEMGTGATGQGEGGMTTAELDMRNPLRRYRPRGSAAGGERGQ